MASGILPYSSFDGTTRFVFGNGRFRLMWNDFADAKYAEAYRDGQYDELNFYTTKRAPYSSNICYFFPKALKFRYTRGIVYAIGMESLRDSRYLPMYDKNTGLHKEDRVFLILDIRKGIYTYLRDIAKTAPIHRGQLQILLSQNDRNYVWIENDRKWVSESKLFDSPAPSRARPE